MNNFALSKIAASSFMDSYTSTSEDTINQDIVNLMTDARRVYFKANSSESSKEEGKKWFGVLEKARQYVEMAQEEIEPGFCLKNMELANTGSHIHIMGGDRKLEDSHCFIVSGLYGKEFVDTIYYYNKNGEHVYLITLKEDDPDLTLEVFNFYFEAMDNYPNYEFEFKPVSVDQFQVEVLPSDYQLIGR